MKHGKYRCNYYKSGTLARNRRARCAAAFVALTVGGVMAASATIPVQASDLTAT